MTVPAPPSSLKAILGPTNTGKTFYAIERMLAYPTGMIGLPLRLLAREVYGRIVQRVGAQNVALVTGEERIVPAKPRYWVATVEAMPTDIVVDCLAIDEIQVATDFDRGHVFTNRILTARGRSETLLLGAATMAPVIRKLLPGAEIIYRPRLSRLLWSGSKKVSRQPQRTAIVAFSAAEVYAIAELVRRERGGAAVVMGALSPRTRNAQVELFENGDVDFLIATDAIGMGLNLDVHHVAFADDTKFDGHQTRPLTPAELGQIAGRAGRHMRDGTFGVTGRAALFDDELVQKLEGHDFDPVRVLQWRNPDLDFGSIDALRASLDTPPQHKSLTRVPVATDHSALEFLARNEAAGLTTSEEAVRLLWACCQIPDYRSISPAMHGEIITRVYSDLRRRGHVDTDWIAEQVRFCDNTSGDIDTLSNRIRQVRTWTFVANRRNWLADPALWRDNTRDIEDRLSDALHERLTQRFVDRRTSVLIRHLRDRLMASPEINERGEVSLEGHLIGTIEGFRFTLAPSDGEADAKGLRAAAAQVVAPQIGHRAERLAGAPNEELVLTTDGFVRWRGEIVATLAEGDTLLAPRLTILADESLSGAALERVEERLSLWLRHLINTQLETVIALAEPTDIEGAARGLAYRLYENLGQLPRSAVADEVKGLDQDVRGKLRKLGVKFGAYHIYLPQSLKPAPRELALILFALKHGGVRQPGVSELPQIVLSGRTSFEIDPEVDQRLYEVAGFKVAGKRAVRIDILERLADIIRPLIAFDASTRNIDLPPGAAEGNGFRVTVEMTSLLGCAGEDFASILTSLGYRVRRTLKPAVAPEPTPATDAAPAPDPEASINDAAMAAVEGVPNEPPPAEREAAEVSTATEDLGAPAPDAPTAPDAETAPASEADAVPAEPEYDEVWSPGGRRSEGRRPPRRQQATTTGEPAAEGAEAEKSGRPRRFRRNAEGVSRNSEGGNRAPDGANRTSDSANRSTEGTERKAEGGNRNGHDQRNGGRPGGGDRHKGPRDHRKGQDAPERRPDARPQREKRDVPIDPDSPWAALLALRNPKSE